MHNESIVTFLIGVVITLIIFLICREIACWYWKINKVVELLEKQNELLSEKLESEKNNV